MPEELTVHSEPPAPLIEPGALYKIPRTLLFASGDASVALGTARAAIDAFVELAGAKMPRRIPTLLREQPMVQADLGLAEARLRSAHAFLAEAVEHIWEAASNGRLSLDERAELRLATTHAIRSSAEVVDTVYNAAGATAIYESHILQRYFQDAHVMTQHIQGRRAHYELVGKHWLGLDIGESEL